MRRLALLASLALLAGLLAARRRRRRAAASIAAPPTPPGDRLSPAAGAPAPTPAAPTLASPSGFVSVSWSLLAAPGDRPELTLRCHQDDELALDRVDVQETPTQVFVTALAHRAPHGDEESARRAIEATVALSRPLGERALIPTPVDAGPAAPPLYP